MGAIPNTVRRAGIYHFRRGIPAALQPILKRVELTCSLGTNDAAVARSLSRYLYLQSEEMFGVVRCVPLLTDQDIAALIKDFYATILSRDESVRLDSDEPVREEVRQGLSDHYRILAERSRIDLASNAFDSVRMITGAMLARRFGIDAKFERSEVRRLEHAMLRAGIEVSETLRARWEGNFNYEPSDKLLAQALRETPSAPISNPAPPSVEVPSVVAGPTFSEAAELFREGQLRRKIWERQTYLQARATYSIFCDFAGDRPLSGYVRADAGRFKALLEELPANYSKAAEYRGLSAQQIVPQALQQDVPRLSSRTVQRHFAALSTLWDSAIEQGTASIKIFNDWKFTAAKRARDQRKMWDSEALQKLFSTPIWTGCQSEHRRSKPGQHVLRDEKFWLPLIAVYSGMRQEEICQLRLTDVRQTEGIWVFDLREGDGRQLKNSNAVRKVPIHNMLIRLGLLNYADALRTESAQLLFPNLQPGGADDRLGHNYSKWFTRYRRDTDLYAEGLDFHSFRHSATTFMKRAGVADSVIDEVTGHATAGETARYNKGLTVANLKDAIDKIDIDVNLVKLEQK